MPNTLLIRADADARSGAGHMMRCLALAQRWRRIGPVVFASARCSPAMRERLVAQGYEVRTLFVEPGSAADAEAVVALAGEIGAPWVVVDGYRFDAVYQRALKAAGLRLLWIDDFGHAGDYCADLVLNQNLDASELLYAQRRPQTRLLLGSRFVLLREEFLALRNTPRPIPATARRVLVTLGGADPDNATHTVLAALQELLEHKEQIEALIVVGVDNPHRAELEEAAGVSGPAVRLVYNAADMPELMMWADVAVTAGGTTCWELAYLGLPSLVVVTAPNQAAVAAALARHGASESLGGVRQVMPHQIADRLRSLLYDEARRAGMSGVGRALISGHGAATVVARMQAADIHLRRATADDCRTVWQWANDPVVRAASFSTEPIDWETHVRWYQQLLDNSQAALYLAALGDPDQAGAAPEPLGQIRFEQEEDQALVSFNLVPEARGKRLAAALIHRGAEQFFADSTAAAVYAHVRLENEASARAVQSAGFQPLDNGSGIVTIRGQAAHRYVLRRSDLEIQ